VLPHSYAWLQLRGCPLRTLGGQPIFSLLAPVQAALSHVAATIRHRRLLTKVVG
jgi:hypothetical protein